MIKQTCPKCHGPIDIIRTSEPGRPGGRPVDVDVKPVSGYLPDGTATKVYTAHRSTCTVKKQARAQKKLPLEAPEEHPAPEEEAASAEG